MEALRIITTPINRQLIIELPARLAGDQPYEVIVLPAIEQGSVLEQGGRRRRPSLAGSAQLHDDLIAPDEAADWEQV